MLVSNLGQDREPRRSAQKSGAPKKNLAIDIPAIPLVDLNRLTSNFGQRSLVGEGSYGRVFYALLPDEVPAAVKKLDPNASQEPDSEFQIQVICLSNISFGDFALPHSHCDLH